MGLGVEWGEDSDVEQIWEQVKQAMVDSPREICGLVRVEVQNPKNGGIF